MVVLQAITAKDGAALGRNILRFAHGETCQVCGSGRYYGTAACSVVSGFGCFPDFMLPGKTTLQDPERFVADMGALFDTLTWEQIADDTSGVMQVR